MPNQKEKNEIIVNEILFWKENRLLPAHFCDYLLTLYTGGNNDFDEKESKPKRSQTLSINLFTSLILLFLPILLLVTYFTELSFVLQMVMSSIFILFCLTGLLLLKRSTLVRHTSLTAMAVVLLMFSSNLSFTYFPHNLWILKGLLFLNCLLWFVMGRKFSLLYFQIAGIVASCGVMISFLL